MEEEDEELPKRSGKSSSSSPPSPSRNSCGKPAEMLLSEALLRSVAGRRMCLPSSPMPSIGGRENRREGESAVTRR